MSVYPRGMTDPSDRRTLAATVPVALAIGVYGAIYATVFVPVAGAASTLLASLVIFSGALQFTVAGLVLAGAGTPSLVAAAVALNLRHILLGAVLRPRLAASAPRRAGLAWFLIDETVGLALAAGREVERTMLLSGTVCYLAWQVGTVIGVLGGSLGALEGAASAVFPVLFIALSALSATRADLVWRALASAALTVAAALLWPEFRGFAPVVAAIAVALPPRGHGGTDER